jgi:hypothetical protein
MHVWAIRVRLQVARRVRDLALFDIALDSKLTSPKQHQPGNGLENRSP